MDALRMLIVTVICGGLVYLLGGTVVSGLRTGRIAHTNSSSFCERRKNPFTYWALAVLFSSMALGCIYGLAKVVIDVLGILFGHDI